VCAKVRAPPAVLHNRLQVCARRAAQACRSRGRHRHRHRGRHHLVVLSRMVVVVVAVVLERRGRRQPSLVLARSHCAAGGGGAHVGSPLVGGRDSFCVSRKGQLGELWRLGTVGVPCEQK